MALRILDGSMGLYLIHTGVPKSNKIWSAAALLDPRYHNHVIEAHKTYLACGSNIITTNNYACIPGYLRQVDMEHQIESLTRLAVSLAHLAKEQFIAEHECDASSIKIAGSIPPLSESYRPDMRLPEALSLKYYSRIVQSLQCDKGVDILLIETMGCLDEALYALRAIASNQTHDTKEQQTEIMISFSLNGNGNLRSNECINEVIEGLEPWLKVCKISSICMNCCTPESIERALDNISRNSLNTLERYNVFLGAYPNGTVAITADWTLKESGFNQIRNDLSSPSALYRRFYKQWIDKYYHKKRLRVLGGCCNIEPHHIKYMVDNARIDFPNLMPFIVQSKL
eukprot:58248_1